MGRWDGHTLNLGGVGRMAAEHLIVVAAIAAAGWMSKNERLLKEAHVSF